MTILYNGTIPKDSMHVSPSAVQRVVDVVIDFGEVYTGGEIVPIERDESLPATEITTVGADPLAYTVLAADSLVNCTTVGVGNITATLEAVANSVGRELQFAFVAKATTGVVVIAGTTATDIIDQYGDTVASITLTDVDDTLALIGDGTHWYVRNNDIPGILSEDTYATTTVTGLGWVKEDMVFDCNPSPIETVDHTAEEIVLQRIKFSVIAITPGVGITVAGFCPDGTWGKYNVRCVVYNVV